MAVFGAPAALEDHAERALHAALAMQRRLPELFDGRLEMRVGVNTGDVVVGASSAGSSWVAGDAVNVADRLQKAAAPGEVLAGERTVAAAAGAFEFGVERTVAAKGKDDGVRGASVLGAVTTMRPRGVGRNLPRVFVGRESELDLLRATYRRAATTGRAAPRHDHRRARGREIPTRPRARQRPPRSEDPPRRRTGRCLAYGDGITYWALGEIVRQHLGIRDGASADDRIRRLEGREILGLALGLDVAPDLHPLDARERLHAAAASFVEELAASRPAALLVEDIHWAEPDLLDLLDRLVADVRAPVLVLATGAARALRPALRLGLRRAEHHRSLARPAAGTAATRMLEEMLPAGAARRSSRSPRGRGRRQPVLPRGARRASWWTAACSLAEKHGWELGEREADFAIPDTVHAVLAARIDRLPARRRRPSRPARSSVELLGRARRSSRLAGAIRTSRSSRIAT